MKIFLVVCVLLAHVFAYVETEQREVHTNSPGHLRTFFFLRRLTPAHRATEHLTPFGAHRRMEGEEKMSPFRSVLVIRRRPEDVFERMMKAEGGESFVRDFLASQLHHMHASSAAQERGKQFNTEKIYEDLYKKSRYPPKIEQKKEESVAALGDEIDSIIANAARELATSAEEPEHTDKTSVGKNLKRTKKKIGKRIDKAKSALRRGFKINGMTIFLILLVGVLSGYAGYCMRGRNESDSYIPLPKQ